LYLCVNETALRKSGQKESGLSFSVEARCRGMSCRTEEGLLQHETIAKGKKFEAAWRKYHAEFSCESQSRLLAILYQSGQDYQFGGITCQQLSQPTSQPKKCNTLDGFLTAEARQMEAYEEKGIFNGVEGNEAFEASRNIGAVKHAENLSGPVDVDDTFDLQLQQALAVSRGDLELQRAIEVSKQHRSEVQDVVDLQQLTAQHAHAQLNYDDALERVIAESNAARRHPGKSHSSPSTEEDDIQRAIRLSMQDSKPAAIATTPPPPGELLDLTDDADESTDTMQPTKKQEPTVEAEEPMEEKASGVTEKRRLFAEAAMRRLVEK
jgi:hypothetical protein